MEEKLPQLKENLGRDLKTGVCGDATLATREKGEKLLELLVKWSIDAIKNVTKI